MNDDVQQQPQRVDQDVPLATLNLLARVVTAAVSFFAAWDAGRTSVRLPAQSPASKAQSERRFDPTFSGRC